MSTRLSLRIQERITHLTKSEQRLAQVILQTPTLIETHTATELAALADVSKATAARFFRSLGYSDFEEVKIQSREERNRTQPYSYSVSESGSTVLGRTIGEHLELELANLTRTFEEMGSDTLQRASFLISEAPRVWFLSHGPDGWIARYGRTLFSRLRHNVHVLGGNDSLIAEDLAMAGPRDVLIHMAQGAQPKSIKPILSYVRATKMNVITLTDHNSLAQAKRYSDIVLRCHISSYGLIPTYTTMVSTLRLLSVAYTGHVSDTAIQRIGLIDDINDELDIME